MDQQVKPTSRMAALIGAVFHAAMMKLRLPVAPAWRDAPTPVVPRSMNPARLPNESQADYRERRRQMHVWSKWVGTPRPATRFQQHLNPAGNRKRAYKAESSARHVRNEVKWANRFAKTSGWASVDTSVEA